MKYHSKPLLFIVAWRCIMPSCTTRLEDQNRNTKYTFILSNYCSLEKLLSQVALEVLSYHNAASCEEVELFSKEDPPTHDQEENQNLDT